MTFYILNFIAVNFELTKSFKWKGFLFYYVLDFNLLEKYFKCNLLNYEIKIV